MKKSTTSLIEKILNDNSLQYLADDLKIAVETTCNRIKNGGKIVVCGNGGSAADSAHIVGELLKSFILPRELTAEDKAAFAKYGADGKILAEKLQYGIPAVALSGSEAISTAVINDNGVEMVYAQQAFGLLDGKDVFIGISTSGNAENVRLATIVAKAKGAFTIAFSGKTGGKLKDTVDLSLIIRLNDTYLIQEKHLPLYHLFCMCLENEFFGN